MKKDKTKYDLIQELRQRWTLLQWPSRLPSFGSDLRKPVDDLMSFDTDVAGYLARIIEDGYLEETQWHILQIDQKLTERIANANDPLAQEFLKYKEELDHCIHLARMIIQ
jgi:hypothetical protein